jgi:hypothetical protein
MAKTTTPVSSTRPVRRTAPGARRSPAAAASNVRWDIPLTKTNLLILGAGIAVIVIGYLLMSTGIADDPLQNKGVWDNAMAVTIAPILLGLGYCVIIPFALLYRRKGDVVDTTNGDAA